MPKQQLDWAVWVKLDEDPNWRIVHESELRESCIKMADLHILKQYPVVRIDVRGPNDHIEQVYKFEGNAA
jgi:hypothetical protein